jgi:hypothetical protein
VDATRGEGADHDEEQHDDPERAELMAKVTGADRVLRTFTQYPTRFHAVARTVLTAQADIIETRMQAEHPWQNQTGEAERNLRCRLFDDGQRLRLRASHGVPYGIWLEVAHQGRYQVLQPTVRSQWPLALHAVADAVKQRTRQAG